MADYGRQTDESGNTVNRPGAGGGTDAYGAIGGNPTDDKYPSTGGEYGTHGTTGTGTGEYDTRGGEPTHGTTGTGEYGAHDGGVTHGTAGTTTGVGYEQQHHEKTKEMMEEINDLPEEKLHGGKTGEEETYSTGIGTGTGTGTTTTTGVGYEEEHPEKKKGMLEKIKEKLPGHH